MLVAAVAGDGGGSRPGLNRFAAIMRPRGAPGLKPPCSRQRLRPRTADRRHGVPARVLAPQAGGCTGSQGLVSSFFMGLISKFGRPRGLSAKGFCGLGGRGWMNGSSAAPQLLSAISTTATRTGLRRSSWSSTSARAWSWRGYRRDPAADVWAASRTRFSPPGQRNQPHEPRRRPQS